MSNRRVTYHDEGQVIRPRVVRAGAAGGSTFHCNELVHTWSMGGRICDLDPDHLRAITNIALSTDLATMPKAISEAWQAVNTPKPQGWQPDPRQLPPGWWFEHKMSSALTPPGHHPDNSPYMPGDEDQYLGTWWTVYECTAVAPYRVISYTQRVSLPGRAEQINHGTWARLEYLVAAMAQVGVCGE